MVTAPPAKKYEQAIKENADKAEWYRFQRALRNIDGDWFAKVKIYVDSHYATNERDLMEIEEIINRLVTSTALREKLRQELVKRQAN